MQVTLETIEKAGTVAIYITLLEGEVARTEEVRENEVFVDFDRKGHVLGIEILAEGKVESYRIIRRIPAPERRQVREAFRKAAHLLAAVA